MVVENDLEELLASLEGDTDSVWPASAAASNPPNAESQITATIPQRASNRTSPSVRAPDQPRGSEDYFQSSDNLPGPKPITPFATRGRLDTSLPLPIALPPPVDNNNISQGQPEKSSIATAPCSARTNPRDQCLAIPDLKGEERPGTTDLRHDALSHWRVLGLPCLGLPLKPYCKTLFTCLISLAQFCSRVDLQEHLIACCVSPFMRT